MEYVEYYKTDEDKELYKRAYNIAYSALNNGKITVLDFLNEREQAIVVSAVNAIKGINISFFGGYDGAEYKKCIISPFIVDVDCFDIVLFKVNYNKHFAKIGHRDVLGAVLGLGLKRSAIGDIIVNDENVYFICSKKISGYLKEQLTIIGKNPITLTEVTNITYNSDSIYNIKKYFVSSLRIDTIIKTGLGISREHSQKLINSEMVKLNQTIERNSDRVLHENDIISIRGFGRIKIFEILGTSKKDKICINIGRTK